MKKLCGCKEKCFEAGGESWAEYGNVICNYYGERCIEGECDSYCTINNESVSPYTNISEHLELIKPDKKLFDYKFESGFPRLYRFINIIGECGERWLSSNERLIDKKCPICDNYFVSGHAYMGGGWRTCPSCDMDTFDMTIEEYKKVIEESIVSHTNDITLLQKEVEDESRIIKAIENKLKI